MLVRRDGANISRLKGGKTDALYEDRLVHDVDSHLMEMQIVRILAEKSLLGRFLEHPNLGVRVGNRLAVEGLERTRGRFFAAAGENIMLRKNYDAQAFLRMIARRYRSYRGGRQLVFTTFCLGNLALTSQRYGPVLRSDCAQRMMTDFGSVDKRLLTATYR